MVKGDILLKSGLLGIGSAVVSYIILSWLFPDEEKKKEQRVGPTEPTLRNWLDLLEEGK